MTKLFLSVIIPCYNEEENLKQGVLEAVKSYLEQQNFKWEVIISDDGSTDGSKELIKKQTADWHNFRILENRHGGKPSTLLHGLNAADGKFILFTDMDQSTPITELDKLLTLIDKKVGAVIGSRGLSRENFPFYRRLGAILFASFRRLMILPEIADTQCGFKLFRAKALKIVFPKLEFFRKKTRASGWMVTSFDVELLHMIKKLGYDIEEIHVDWLDSDESKSKGSPFGKYLRESREMFLQILKVKINDIRGFYNTLANT
jgi:dolichyl-phosphate beta-glucosyltransferase